MGERRNDRPAMLPPRAAMGDGPVVHNTIAAMIEDRWPEVAAGLMDRLAVGLRTGPPPRAHNGQDPTAAAYAQLLDGVASLGQEWLEAAMHGDYTRRDLVWGDLLSTCGVADRVRRRLARGGRLGA
jgi:hypothetical protein